MGVAIFPKRGFPLLRNRKIEGVAAQVSLSRIISEFGGGGRKRSVNKKAKSEGDPAQVSEHPRDPPWLRPADILKCRV